MTLKTRKELNRRIIQLEENNKDWEKQYQSYRDAYHMIRVQLNEALEKASYLERRVDSLEKLNRDIQIKANESCRRAWQQHK